MARRSDHSREELYVMALAAAREIAEKDGLRGLKARRISREIGYTVGTLYNVFSNLDDLIIHLNGTTLDALYVSCAQAPLLARHVIARPLGTGSLAAVLGGPPR